MVTSIQEAEPRLATEIALLWPPQGQWTEQDYLSLPVSSQKFVAQTPSTQRRLANRSG